MKNGQPSAYLSVTLHAHLPYVINHGTWPHGLEWLHEAVAETYLPLLGVLRRLERDGFMLKANLSLSPIFMEQLCHPTLLEEFPKYIERKLVYAREDENYFRQNGETHFAETAVFWQEFYDRRLREFYDLDRNLVGAFRHFQDIGAIEIIGGAASHGYLPLLGTDESLTAQLLTGVAAHERHMGRKPRGMWIPDCGYRPAGEWAAPVRASGEETLWAPFPRIGVEEALAAAGIEFFFVDTHMVEQKTPAESELGPIYRPSLVEGPLSHAHPVAAFSRDPKTSLQVWSGDSGYPADPHYLEFHKKRWPGGLRYWQVTLARSDMAHKTPYFPEQAEERARVHAEHFVGLVYDALRGGFDADRPPILSALYDAELFGHWWFEGPLWLEHVVRIIARDDFPIALTTASEYLDKYPAEAAVTLPEGSWGKNGNNEVWLNDDTSWTWSDIYRVERVLRDVATGGRWRDGLVGERIAKQMAREVLLLESSDWQFLITTAAARDYAEKRFSGHLGQFVELEMLWAEFLANGKLSEPGEKLLSDLEERDGVFAEIDPGLWAAR
jgi:1,4-alpha-glucan branching enzyme